MPATVDTTREILGKPELNAVEITRSRNLFAAETYVQGEEEVDFSFKKIDYSEEHKGYLLLEYMWGKSALLQVEERRTFYFRFGRLNFEG